jgi:hypothetical protein
LPSQIPFEIDLNHPIRSSQAPIFEEVFHPVSISTSSPNFNKIQSQFASDIRTVVEDEEARLGWKARGTKFGAKRIAVQTHLGDSEADLVVADIQQICKKDAGTIRAEGFILGELAWGSAIVHSRRPFSKLAEFPFRG